MTKLLYVEADENNAFMLTQRMRRHGIVVQHIGDGEKALASLAEECPTVLLLDLNLPGVDGLSILGRLRGQPATHSLPVIVVSASVQEQARASALAAGADAFIPKPIDFALLLEALSRWLPVTRIQGGRA
jgi:CheY-like chemotaxis protein